MIESYINEISAFVPKGRLFTDPLRTLAWGTDAGFYRLIPKVVVMAQDEAEVSRLLALATKHGVPVTFRAAGTSLSGQSITDSVLIVAAKGWEGYNVSDDATTITMQPGIIGARVNQILAPYGRTFTPDPASKASSMVGGIVINNASGMCCGTHANSDKMMRSMRIVLADGTIIDTAHPSGSEREKALLAEIADIRDEIRADEALTERIRHKYSIKNVTGLNLRPFVAYDDPMEIVARLMVGSEGTLAFMSEATMLTAPVMAASATIMAYFASMQEACRAVVKLKKDVPEVYSCEMLDKKSLASVNDTTGPGLTALLIETRGVDAAQVEANSRRIVDELSQYDLYKPAEVTTDPARVAQLWQIRSGIFPSVGGTRPLGTTSLIEDIAFHIDDLPQATADLANLIEECGYDDACIYGHAFEGNYHFVIAQAFENKQDVDKYRNLIDRIVELVVDKYDGSLKAEHGTGRNMAPFVRREWGDKAYELMYRVKRAFDPDNLLNPGVIFNDDPECHLRDFKPLPLTHPIVDKCIECGFCEVNCVSCGLTLSARQRIVARREISRLQATGQDAERRIELEKSYKYLGEETCAADGLCSMSCPMGINTGDLTHVIRTKRPGTTAYKVGDFAANHLAGVESALRPVLWAANLAHNVLGDSAVTAIGNTLHSIGVPLWTPSLPKPKSRIKGVGDTADSDRKVVYFPSCINQTMGESKGTHAPLVDTIVKLCHKAGYQVIFPENMAGLCCGMIWESKGMADIADRKTRELEAALLKASDGGRYPVMCDQSPCLHRMRQHIKGLRLYEPAEFIADFLAPHLQFHQLDEKVAVHVTCSSRLMGLNEKIIGLAKRCAKHVLVPDEVGCCGFAGDKGFTHPELNKWALRKLRPQIEAFGATAGYSNSRTCELGLTTNSGIPYQSIAYLVDRATEGNEK